MMQGVWKRLAKHYRSVIDLLFEAGTSGPCGMGAHSICKLQAPPYCLCSCHGNAVRALVEEQRQRRTDYERTRALARGSKSDQ